MAEGFNPIKGASKQAWVIAGVAGVGVLGYLWWKKKQQASTAATSAYGYSGYGYSSGYGYGVSPIFGYGLGGTNFPFPTGYGGYGYQGIPTPTTNAEWFRAAVNYLSQNANTNMATAEAALAKYLAGQTVTSDQVTIIQIAEGAFGPPPQNGPDGYPPNIKTGGSGGGGHAKNPVTGLHITKQGTTGDDVAWNPSAGAHSYKVTATHGNVSMIGATSARIHNIGPDHWSSTVHVLAEPADPHARDATLTVYRKK